MKNDKNIFLIIGGMLSLILLWVVFAQMGPEETSILENSPLTTEVPETEDNSEESEDPIAQVISDKQSKQVQILNDCLGTEVYSLNPTEILENITEGKYSDKNLITIQKNFHGTTRSGEKLRFAYKRIEFQNKNLFELNIVKVGPDNSFETMEYSGDEKFESVKSYFQIEEVTLKEETKTFTKNDISLYFTQGEKKLRELTLAIKDKVIACERTETFKCECRQ